MNVTRYAISSLNMLTEKRSIDSLILKRTAYMEVTENDGLVLNVGLWAYSNVELNSQYTFYKGRWTSDLLSKEMSPWEVL